jgi:two-component system OmpR family response regulator
MGCALELEALRAHPSLQRRVTEFWADQPTPEMITNSRLNTNLFIGTSQTPKTDAIPTHLTAKESRLYAILQDYPGVVCEKDMLIQAVWPEDVVYEDGIRDDSLAQLIRRLRKKIEPDPKNPSLIQTIPGRGYLFQPPE